MAMNATSHPTPPGKSCPVCGTSLPNLESPGPCPKCLLAAGLSTARTIRLSPAGETPGAPSFRSHELPRPGEFFGHYRIARLLGKGGMGAVFEAEDLETGRRLALKVLGQALDSPESRQRFLREGRLAASINHPNSVYVYGTEEIGGTPVIAMELVPGGTLQERVAATGPLAVPAAVDATIQIIAGLEAAQALGILHRDIKPSNCFEDRDGAVKIGDFGLSISTVRTDPNVTAQGILLGTPAFSSPEQLRGEELNARSDLYSVGVTLFYLLTGRTPFEGHTVVQLVANVLEKPAPAPSQFRKEIPEELARAVLRCLEKQPGERFRNYDELRQALAPFNSMAPVPASLALRFLAGVLDTMALGLVGVSLSLALFGGKGWHPTRRFRPGPRVDHRRRPGQAPRPSRPRSRDINSPDPLASRGLRLQIEHSSRIRQSARAPAAFPHLASRSPLSTIGSFGRAARAATGSRHGASRRAHTLAGAGFHQPAS